MIYLTTINNFIFFVSTKDALNLIGRSWIACKNRNHYYIKESGGTNEWLHRLILKAKPNEIGDHINGDGLDNRRKNIRLTNHTGNMRNSRSYTGTSKFKGVSRFRDKWKAQIHLGKKAMYLGLFKTEEKAARTYDSKAKELYGNEAYLNYGH